MDYQIIEAGTSRSFPSGDPLVSNACTTGEVLLITGDQPTAALQELAGVESFKAVLVELGTECLGVHTGESAGMEGSNIVGYARFRLGDDQPSDLVELVRQPHTCPQALEAARALFEDAGLEVAICNDFAGRIIDRLVRPYYNEALKRLDEKLASASDMDMTLKLGLGYPEGPIALLERSGLHHHYAVTQALFEVYGEKHYAPARRATVAHQRRQLLTGQPSARP